MADPYPYPSNTTAGVCACSPPRTSRPTTGADRASVWNIKHTLGVRQSTGPSTADNWSQAAGTGEMHGRRVHTSSRLAFKPKANLPTAVPFVITANAILEHAALVYTSLAYLLTEIYTGAISTPEHGCIMLSKAREVREHVMTLRIEPPLRIRAGRLCLSPACVRCGAIRGVQEAPQDRISIALLTCCD